MRVTPAGGRRAQIVAATIQVVADEGYAQASFARIAERAGLSSTRLISYHFAGKAELVSAVVEHVVAAIGDEVGRRVRQESSAAGRLRAYIEGVVEYTDGHRAEMRTLLQILLSGSFPPGAGADDAVPGHVVAILRQGQADGEFRDFDPTVMALAVQRSVEALPFALQGDPDLDCAAFAAELVTLFELATRRTTP
jgi:AcrR family transcriptional regulator